MKMMEEQQEELDSLVAIFPELAINPDDPFTVSLELATNPVTPLLVRFVPTQRALSRTLANVVNGSASHIEHDVRLSHLPPLILQMTLPKDYPESSPPKVHLSTHMKWLPEEKLSELEHEVIHLWEEYGRSQVLYVYIDHLQQAAERGFDLDHSEDGCLVMPMTSEADIVAFDSRTKQATFDAGTYDCGVCLERRKGADCYRMKDCQHIFCRECLQAFYNNAIKEGDIAGIRCLDPGCGSEQPGLGNPIRKRKKKGTLHPAELIAMGIDESVVHRFLSLKRKKKLEADKSTVYCPRTWCQGPAKSAKYPPIPSDIGAYLTADPFSNDESEDEADPVSEMQKVRTAPDGPPNPDDRLAVCEECSFAFCRVCFMGWHGPFARCYPRDPRELSVEEKASYEYIRMHTSPCAYCHAPVQKTMGCNHMCCFQCKTHFCYLCGAWLDGRSPYAHFNTPKTPCFQRLWELEEGDEGQRPGDGRGFGGDRGWEQMAAEVARQAEEEEAEAAAAEVQVEEDRLAVRALPPAPDPPPVRVPIEVAVRQARAPPRQRGGRRQRNPFPNRPPPRGVAEAVWNHERGGARRQPAVAVLDDGGNEWDERRQAELQRFLEMAQRDEEEDWDSDDIDDDDERFIIR